MEEMAIMQSRGETISVKDESMLRHVELYKFNMELIEERLIENFTDSGSLNSDEMKNNLSLYLKEKTGRGYDFISDEINRMIGKGCLEISQEDSSRRITWV